MATLYTNVPTRNASARTTHDPTVAQAGAGATGQIKYWSGSAWTAKPVKYWTGSVWTTKPMKHYNGTIWVTTPY